MGVKMKYSSHYNHLLKDNQVMIEQVNNQQMDMTKKY